MLLEKRVRSARAKTMQAHQKLPLWIELAARPTAVGSLIGSDAMDVQVADPVEHVLPEAMLGRFLRQGTLEKSQVLELLHKACVEGDFVEPAGNIGRVAGSFLTGCWVQLDDEQIRRVAFLNEGQQRRIAQIPAIPVGIAFDLDRLKQLRQTGRGHNHLSRQIAVAEDAQRTRLHTGRRYKEPNLVRSVQSLEIYGSPDDVDEWVDVEGIPLIGREGPREGVRELVP